MDLRLTDEQEQLVDAFVALYARHATPEHVRAAEPVGFDKALWDQLLELGVVAMAVDEAEGGWGASPLDLALVAEQHGRSVAPAPLIEAQVAARLLARVGEPAASSRARPASGSSPLALHPPVDGRARARSGRRRGRRRDRLDRRSPPARSPRGRPRRGSRTSGRCRWPTSLSADGEVLASGDDQGTAAFEAALDDWLLLTGGSPRRLGARSLEIGVEYVKERKAFDVPIGSFQAIVPPPGRLGDGRSTVPDCSRTRPRGRPTTTRIGPTELAALAFAFADEAARDATYRSLHFHGGYGFMMEYDIQLFWRRARAWANVWGEPAAGYRRAADARYGRR